MEDKVANKDKTAEFIGPAANGVGVNVYPLAVFNGTTVTYSAPVTIEKTEILILLLKHRFISITEGRPVVRETTLTDFIAKPGEANEEAERRIKKVRRKFCKGCYFISTL